MKSDSETEFREYVDVKRDALRRFAYMVCGDWHRAEDVVQTVLIRLYGRWGRIAESGAVDPYVRRMIVNALNDIRRRSWFRRERSTVLMPDRAAPGVEDAEIRRTDLLRALGELPVRRRATLVLRFWEDKTVEETAQIMGCSVSTVKSQTARGLDTLRGLLSEASLTAAEGAKR